ncbi:MAG: hypothetical protein U1E65_03290 [Myxococcota bacterium]
MASVAYAGCSSPVTGPADTGTSDGSLEDAGVRDATVVDAGGMTDAAAIDSGIADAGSSDSGMADASPSDSGAEADAGFDAGAGAQSCDHPVAIANNVGAHFFDLWADDQFVFWYEDYYPLGGAYAQRVYKVPADGSAAPIVVFEDPCNNNSHGVFTADADNIYLNCVQVIDANRAVQIVRVPKTGTVAQPIYTSDRNVAALDLNVSNMGADGTSVFFTANNSSEYRSIPRAGGPLNNIDPPDPRPAFIGVPYNITLFGGIMYWTTNYNQTGALVGMPSGGGAPVLLANDDALFPGGNIGNLVIRDGYIYWRGMLAPYALWRLPLAGGTPTKIASLSFGGAQGQIALFGDNAYFADYVNGDLLVQAASLTSTSTGASAPASTVIGTVAPPANFVPLGLVNRIAANSTHLFVADPGIHGDGHIYRCE